MKTQKDCTFRKNERLCHKQSIETLFKKGDHVFLYPFKLMFKHWDIPSNLPTQVVISVSKRSFKLATDRNLIKRRLREIYRTHKDLFSVEHLAIIYVAKEKIDYNTLQKKFVQVSKKIQ